jgi:iron complex transport system substrate-binding protein
MYRWYPPSSDSPLSLLWLAKQNHPDLFADIDLPEEIKKYFIRFYNVELTDEDIVKIMNPPREAADGA